MERERKERKTGRKGGRERERANSVRSTTHTGPRHTRVRASFTLYAAESNAISHAPGGAKRDDSSLRGVGAWYQHTTCYYRTLRSK
eukprot:1143382-Rhodomonas_salina.1